MKGVRLAQKMQVEPCIPVGIQREKAEVGPTSGPAWRIYHLVHKVVERQVLLGDGLRPEVARLHPGDVVIVGPGREGCGVLRRCHLGFDRIVAS